VAEVAVSKKRRMDDEEEEPLPLPKRVQFSAPEDHREQAIRKPVVSMNESVHSYIDSDLSNLFKYI
jgi:hypothetical protein